MVKAVICILILLHYISIGSKKTDKIIQLVNNYIRAGSRSGPGMLASGVGVWEWHVC